MNENARLLFPGSSDVQVSVRQFHVNETTSGLFFVRLEVVSPQESLDLQTLVNRHATFELEGSVLRRWHGVCESAELLKVSDDRAGLATYEFSLVPTLWRLTQRRQNRLFQHLSIPEIVKKILDEWRIEHTLALDAKRYPLLELRTQYGETDFEFISRLLEEAGISYWFVDDGEKDLRVHIGDAPERNAERPGLPLPFIDDPAPAQAARIDYVTALRLREVSKPGRVTVHDFAFHRPRSPLYARAESARKEELAHEQHLHVPGISLHEALDLGKALSPAPTPVADDMGVARFHETQAQQYAQTAVEAFDAQRRIVTFDTSVNDLAPGKTFRIAGHPHGYLQPNQSLLAIRQRLTGKVAKQDTWTFSVVAVPADKPYRPARVTLRPRIMALQTAVVVGPGDGVVLPGITAPGAVGAVNPVTLDGHAVMERLVDNEIYVDEHGRVRVQFPWDREHSFDKQSSIWMRVSQGWAGAGYGMFTIPRVGHEVLVAFIDGDPDNPMIVGRVHNVNQPVPFPLPANKTVSTLKTASSPGGGGFNELRFDDAADREHVYLQAQKDMDQLVKNNLKEAVGNDRSSYVQGDEARAVGGQSTAFVNHNQIEATGLSRATFAGVHRTATVGAEDSTVVGSRWSVTVARGLTGKLTKELERIASGVGGVLRSAATGVLGPIVNDPLARAAESALAKLGQSAFQGLQGALGLVDGFESGPGPAPTVIEMVDRQIKLTTGEASIVLDGPNVAITAQGAITMHAMQGVSLWSEQELAVAGREKVVVVSATDDVVLQAGKNLHLNPFEPGERMEAASTLEGEHLDEMQRCDVCGGKLIASVEGWYCPEDPVFQTPTE